jgi:hypothetical protein
MGPYYSNLDITCIDEITAMPICPSISGILPLEFDAVEIDLKYKKMCLF